MASINNLMSNLGWLIGISLGLVVPVQYYSLVLASPSLVFLALSWRIPESPIWQIRNGMKEAGRATLVWLRGAKYNVEVELAELEEIVREEKRQTSDQTITSSLLNRTFLWPLVISCFLFTFSALRGRSSSVTTLGLSSAMSAWEWRGRPSSIRSAVEGLLQKI